MSGQLPEHPTSDLEGDYFTRMEAVRQRDSARLVSVKLESRTPSAAVHDCGLVEAETFVFALVVMSLTPRHVHLTIRVTAELALALAEEHPGDADMLVAAWSELTTVADELNEAASRGGVGAERGRRIRLGTPEP